MKSLVLKAYAKINWALDVIAKRPDGYHQIMMIMQSIDLHDVITILEADCGIALKSNWDCIPLNSDNIAYKAAALMMDIAGMSRGVEISLTKRIPMAAGMGGGSADAAAVLKGLNLMWNIKMNDADLMGIAVALGADVPFCVLGGTALAAGIGEELTPLKSVNGIWLVLVKPKFGISTAQVYKNLELSRIGKRPDIAGMLGALMDKDLRFVAKHMVNVLEQVACKMHPEIEELKRDMLISGAIGSLMSGSGPTVYGIFEQEKHAAESYQRLKKRYPQSFLACTSAHGVEIIEEDLN